MKLLSAFAVFAVLLTFSGCPQKPAEQTEVSSEPVEGASTAPSEKASGGGGDEMQEKKGGAEGGDAAAPAEGHK